MSENLFYGDLKLYYFLVLLNSESDPKIVYIVLLFTDDVKLRSFFFTNVQSRCPAQQR